jgi:hypothetical protein
MADIETSATTATSQRRVLFSGVASHLPEFWVTRLTRVHFIRPSGLPLACDQWMEHRPLGFLPGFTPRRYQRRMPGAETSVEHSLGANRRSPRPSISVISLTQCDLMSHAGSPVLHVALPNTYWDRLGLKTLSQTWQRLSQTA